MTVHPPQASTMKLTGPFLTATLAIMAFTVQWGMVTTKLDHLNTRINELLIETRTARENYADHERRLSTLEGIVNGQGRRE